MKDRVKDVILLALAVGVIIGGFHLFSIVQVHRQMDRALLQFVERLQAPK